MAHQNWQPCAGITAKMAVASITAAVYARSLSYHSRAKTLRGEVARHFVFDTKHLGISPLASAHEPGPRAGPTSQAQAQADSVSTEAEAEAEARGPARGPLS